VDLLTTGVDVPAICTLVFLRRVNSRIFFEWVLGRATRLCPESGKKNFRLRDDARDFETVVSMPPGAVITHLQTLSLQEVGDWFARNIRDHARNGAR